MKTSGDSALRGGERPSSPLMAAPQVCARFVAAPRIHLSVRSRSSSLAAVRRLCARPFVAARMVCAGLLLQCIELELALSWRSLDLMPGLAFRWCFVPAPCLTIRSGLQPLGFHNVVAFSIPRASSRPAVPSAKAGAAPVGNSGPFRSQRQLLRARLPPRLRSRPCQQVPTGQ
jgi:hypothetical protein